MTEQSSGTWRTDQHDDRMAARHESPSAQNSAPRRAARSREFRNLNALTDLPTYRLPATGWVSILHRISGVILVFYIPVLLWAIESLEQSLSSTDTAAPEWLIAASLAVFVWAATHHILAGLRHLWMDVSHRAVDRTVASRSAVLTLILSGALTVLICGSFLR